MLLAHERSGAGSPVVLVHGFTQTGRSWRHLVPRLVAAGHEVITVDAPGHGGSGAVRADLWLGADLLAATGGRAAYVGYSMGGRLVLHLALRHPSLVERLVVLGATGGIDDPTERAGRRAADAALADSIAELGVERFVDRWLAQPLFAGLPDDPEDRADRRRNTAPGLASSLLLAGTGSQEPLWERVAALTMPVLVVAGARDPKFVALGRRLADAIGSNARFATVPGAGHAAHLEAPDAFAELVVPFLSLR